MPLELGKRDWDSVSKGWLLLANSGPSARPCLSVLFTSLMYCRLWSVLLNQSTVEHASPVEPWKAGRAEEVNVRGKEIAKSVQWDWEMHGFSVDAHVKAVEPNKTLLDEWCADDHPDT
jgi:hypothetical protein